MSCIVYVLVESSVSELCLCRLDMKYIESDAKWHAVLTSQKPVSNVEGKVCSYVLSESGAVVSGNVVIALTAFISSVCESRIAIYVYDKKTDSIVNTIGWSDVKSSIDNRHVGQLCRLSPTASSTEFSYLSSLKATPQVSACSDSLAVIRIETAGDRSTAFVSAEVSAVYQWPRFHKFASSPNGDFVYLWGGALADGVAILRTGAQSTFAGVEYPLGFLRVDDSTMYLEREDEFDKSITVQEDKASTKSAKTSVKSQASGSNAKKKNSRKWFEVDEPEGGAVSLTYTADYNAIINAEYFQSVKRRRLENGVINDVVMMSAEIDLVNCELHPLKNDHSLPVLPSDFAFTTESKSNITSIGPSKDNRLMLKGGAFIADPTRKILTSSSHKRPQSVAKLSAAMKAGVDPVNEYGAPPFGSPYLIDAFNRRLGGLTANDCTSRVPKLLNGISNNYFNKLQNLHGTILSNLDKHIEISARIRAAVDNTDRLRNHRMELKVRRNVYDT